jgi:hypothetical protein
MMRWVIVTLALLAVLAALVGVRSYEAAEHVFDEVSAYEITPARALHVRIPAGVEEVVMTTWAVLAPAARFDPLVGYRYGVDVELASDAGQRVQADALTLESRVSYDPTRPIALGGYCARLAESEDWLADPRTTRVSLRELSSTGGRALVRVRTNEANQRVLVRLTYLTPLTEFERDIRSRTLRIERSRRMVLGRTSLGFDDLPIAVRERALSHWERRFPAIGHEGSDYVSRTVLIGNRLPSVPAADAPEAELHVGPRDWVALNFARPVKLRVHARSGTVLDVGEGTSPRYSVAVGETERADLDLGGERARTVSIGARESAKLQLSLALEESDAQIGVSEGPLEERRVFVRPDVRVQRYLALDPDRPVLFRLAPGQTRLGLNVRGLVSGKGAEAPVSVTLQSADGPAFALEPFEATLAASLFDRVGLERVSVARNAVVTLPPGVTRIRVYGRKGGLVSGWVPEPGISVDRVETEYAVPLEPGEVWRHAPCIEKTAAAIRAENDAELDREGRIARLEAQVRIEPLQTTGPALVERVVRPLGDALTRLAFMPVTFTATMSPADLWTLLPDKAVELQVPAERVPGAGFMLQYRAPPAALGAELSLEVDGHTEQRSMIVTGTGELKASVPRGRRRVGISGPPGLVAFAAAPRAAGGRAFRRQLVHELAPGRPLDFELTRAADELVSVFADVVREAGPGTVRLTYAIDPGKPPPVPVRLYRRLTALSGELAVDALDSVRGRVWEADVPASGAPLPHAVGKLRIVLGDDLEPGRHVLRLSAAAGAGTLWVRVVVAGRRLAPEGDSEERP